MRSKKRITLYFSSRSVRAGISLSKFLEFAKANLDGSYEINVIDVLKNPQAAIDNSIIATPTVIKDFMPPPMRIVGELNDLSFVEQWLAIESDERHGQVMISGVP